MNATELGALDRALDDHVDLMQRLVEAAQTEQQHLVAFETRALMESLEDKRRCVEASAEAEARTRQAAARVRAGLGLTEAEAPTLRDIVRHLPEPHATRTLGRCDCLRALAQSLTELHAISLVHADRGLRLVHAYASLLSSSGVTDDAGTYAADGRQRAEGVPSRTLMTSA